MIEEISLIEEINIEHKEQILLTKLKYDALTEDQKTQITGFDILEAAVSRIMILEVNTLISGIPVINDLTLTDKEMIFEIKKQYDALTEDQKTQITGFVILEAAVSKILDLEIAEVDQLILNIPELETIDLTHKEQIMQAKDKYDALNEEQKSRVINYDKLSDAVDKITSLENPPTATPTLTTTPAPEATPTLTVEPTPA